MTHRTMRFTLAALVGSVSGHGHLTLPGSTRNGGKLATGGDCTEGQCLWFSNNVEIPGPITLPNAMRTIQIDVTGQPKDVYATSPWRSPGTAPVYGSGCGAAGGGPVAYANGGVPPPGIKQGLDGVAMPKHGLPAIWTRGTEVDVAWAISANHGGGYSYRLCPANGNVSEACFQANPLNFSGTSQWVLYPDGRRTQIPLVTTTIGTSPPGSQWARDPVPECYVCDAYETCGAPLPPQPNAQSEHRLLSDADGAQCTAIPFQQCGVASKNGNCLKCAAGGAYDCLDCCPGTTRENITKGGVLYFYCSAGAKKPNKWNEQVNCYGACAGSSTSKGGSCPAGTTAFPEPAPHISGFGKSIFPWSVADKVLVPTQLRAGAYLLSWRWDCEESTQVWQNCADVTLI